jgi:hypothetical protein
LVIEFAKFVSKYHYMKRLLLLIAFFLSNEIIFAQINITTGGTGSFTSVPQSYNETRGADVLVLPSPQNLYVVAMGLKGFISINNQNSGYAFIDARIYNSATKALVAVSRVDTVLNSAGAKTLAVPISCVLVPGNTYRVCFSCSGPNPPTDNSATLFQPDSFPYTDTTGALQILNGYDGAIDSMPMFSCMDVPQIIIKLGVLGINEMEQENALSVYPNPSNGVFKITSTGSYKIQSIDTYSFMGQKLFSTGPVAVGNQEENIDMSAQPAGMYFLQLITSEGAVTRKIIISR